MAQVIFYEKPGCVNNRRQKKLLAQAGHSLIVKDLLSENWSDDPQRLREFFGCLPVAEWFNRSAPAIKQGAVEPTAVTADQAIVLMLGDPLLIRRPLMQVGNMKMAGFDEHKVDSWIGLNESKTGDDLEHCPKSQPADGCHG